jgi:hypothetical protein
MPAIPDKNQRQLLKRYPTLVVSHTKRHLKISHPANGDFVIAPSSGSDWRGLRNLDRDLRRLADGVGYLARNRPTPQLDDRQSRLGLGQDLHR